MAEAPGTRLIFSFAELIGDDLGRLVWTPMRPGVERCDLYSVPGGSAASVLRYAPGGRTPRHRHDGHEHIVVLSGSQEDDHGVYETGAVIVNPPGSSHAVQSPGGCVVLVVWERAIHFEDDSHL
ncbi:MAG TPA: cupin domain-containing protein [Polyangiaceae bacterium]|nr:cupin domain-containing protein [Polyangiaceae bacterium]